MTVICWDGKILAADSRVTSDSALISDNYHKIIKLDNVNYFGDDLLYAGISGRLADRDYLVAYLHSEEFSNSNDCRSDHHDLSAIIVGKQRVYSLDMGCIWLISYPKKTKLASGTGRPYALSAMGLGLNAINAVKHTCKFDLACGGKIRSVVPK